MTPSGSPTKTPFGNLVVNGGFESATLEGWQVYEIADYIQVVNVPHTGSYSLYLGGNVETQPHSSLNFVGQYPNLTLNTNYELSFWAKATEMTGQSILQWHSIEVFMDGLPYPKLEMYQSNPAYEEWMLYTYPFTYDASFASFAAEGLRFGGYHWYIDDVVLVQTSPI